MQLYYINLGNKYFEFSVKVGRPTEFVNLRGTRGRTFFLILDICKKRLDLGCRIIFLSVELVV